MVEIPPAADAKNVFAATVPINSQLPTAPSVEPGLNANQPNHNINAPTAAKGKLCPGMAFATPSLLYFPILGPKTMAAAKAENPPIACTAAEPAKSLKPLTANHPFGFHTQLATKGYITAQNTKTYTA